MLKDALILLLFVINIGYDRQVKQWSVLSDNDCAVDQNCLLDFNSEERKEFWSVADWYVIILNSYLP